MGVLARKETKKGSWEAGHVVILAVSASYTGVFGS